MPTYVPTKIPFAPDGAIRVHRAGGGSGRAPYPQDWVATVGGAFCYGSTPEEALAKLKARMLERAVGPDAQEPILG
jgi:hypothetical protein